jgi:hypothetical protein
MAFINGSSVARLISISIVATKKSSASCVNAHEIAAVQSVTLKSLMLSKQALGALGSRRTQSHILQSIPTLRSGFP